MQLDDNFYAALGVELTEAQKQTVAQNVYSELEDKVGENLESRLSDQQFQEFEKIIAKGDEYELSSWLEANSPGYERLSEQIFEQIKQSVLANPAGYIE